MRKCEKGAKNKESEVLGILAKLLQDENIPIHWRNANAILIYEKGIQPTQITTGLEPFYRIYMEL